jgi:septum formation inhibitor MinC
MDPSREERIKNRSQKKRLAFLEEQNESLEKRVASLKHEIAQAARPLDLEELLTDTEEEDTLPNDFFEELLTDTEEDTLPIDFLEELLTDTEETAQAARDKELNLPIEAARDKELNLPIEAARDKEHLPTRYLNAYNYSIRQASRLANIRAGEKRKTDIPF